MKDPDSDEIINSMPRFRMKSRLWGAHGVTLLSKHLLVEATVLSKGSDLTLNLCPSC